jgi:tetratricopeptide (TPR) repeat protein
MISNSVPQEAVAIYNHALELSNKGDLARALDEYQKALEVHPKFVAAYNNIGEIHARMGDRARAIDNYKEALKISKHFRVLLNLGVEYFNARDFKNALKFFKESLSKSPNFLEVNFYSGLVYHKQDDFKKAEKHFLEVVKVDQKHLKANYLLSYIYYEWKEYKKTLKCLDTIKDIADDKTFLNKYYGFCYYYLGKYQLAVDHLTVALESRPEYKKFKKYLASLTYEKKVNEVGDVDKAIKEMEGKMMNQEPEITELTRLSMLYIFKGENKKAEKLIQSYKKKIAS